MIQHLNKNKLQLLASFGWPHALDEKGDSRRQLCTALCFVITVPETQGPHFLCCYSQKVPIQFLHMPSQKPLKKDRNPFRKPLEG